MSEFYRYRLQIKEKVVGLSDQEYDDLHHPKSANIVVKNVRDTDYIPEDIRRTKEGEFALNRPSERHVLEAQRLQQQREEAMLRELDTHRQYAKELMSEMKPEEKKRKWLFF